MLSYMKKFEEVLQVKKICIVTTKHISYNPRVLKEADAFYNRGYKVTVVTINNHSNQYQFDCELMSKRKWSLRTVNFRKDVKHEKKYWLYLSLQQKFYSLLTKLSFEFGFAERATLKGYDALVSLAKKEKADFYLAHHAEALGVAYQAAQYNNAGFGFDAEDFHTGMNESSKPSSTDGLLSYLEAKYLPHCIYFTAASKGIEEAYTAKYSLHQPNTILNVFPKENIEVTGVNRPIRFYWYSQVIGPNRSLENLLAAAAQIKEPFEIHLRGSFHDTNYQKLLFALVEEYQLKSKVFFHEPILAEHIIREATNYDVGLALESDISINRNICVTNKIFSYLTSGLAIIGTDTYGQKDIFSHFSEAVLLCRMNDPEDLARAMLLFIQEQDKLLLAKKAARKAVEDRFNWKAESEKLINVFEEAVLQQSPVTC